MIEARLAEVETRLVPELSEEERKKVFRDARYWRHQLKWWWSSSFE